MLTSGSLAITPSMVTRWLASRWPLALTCVAPGKKDAAVENGLSPMRVPNCTPGVSTTRLAKLRLTIGQFDHSGVLDGCAQRSIVGLQFDTGGD